MMANDKATREHQKVAQTHRKFSNVLCVAGVLMTLLVFCAHFVRAEDNDRVLVGEVCAIGGSAKVIHSFASDDNTAEIGMKVFAGDLVETGNNGSIELILGLNRRLRLGGDSSVKLLTVREKASEVSGEKIYSQTLIMALRQGELRIRVRRNLITPTPALIRIGNVEANLPRADFIVRRISEGAAHLEKCVFSLLWGEANMNLKVVGEKDWNPELIQQVNAPAEGSAPIEPVARDKVVWKAITAQQAQELKDKVPFSIEQIGNAPGDAPVQKELLPGA